MIRPPPRSTRFPTRRSSDLGDASIRAQGYAVALDELEQGLSAVAAPVLGPGGTAVAALSISGPTIRLTPKRIAEDRKSTRLNSSHPSISYAVFCLKKKNHQRCDPNAYRFQRYGYCLTPIMLVLTYVRTSRTGRPASPSTPTSLFSKLLRASLSHAS